MHSATKYLNGHSDVIAGSLTTARTDEFWQKLVADAAAAARSSAASKPICWCAACAHASAGRAGLPLGANASPRRWRRIRASRGALSGLPGHPATPSRRGR